MPLDESGRSSGVELTPSQFSGVGSRVPDDIWNIVFRLLHASGKSVANVSLCSRRFHAIALPLLFQNLQFHHSRIDKARALCRLLTGNESRRPYVQDTDVDWITWSDHRMIAGCPPGCIRALLVLLPNLQVVSLSGVFITIMGATALSSMRELRSLSISSSCRLSKGLHNEILTTTVEKHARIEKLVIGEVEYDDPRDLVAFLSLLLSPDLKDLQVLGGLATGRFFIECLHQQVPRGCLKRLHVEHNDGALLYELVANQPNLQHLHFYCQVPSFPTDDTRLPPNLSSWSGPSCLASRFIPGSNIDTMRFWMHSTLSVKQSQWDELYPLYHEALKLALRPIRSLEMLHIEYEQCIFDCIVEMLPSLERLSVWLINRPDMDYLAGPFTLKLSTMRYLKYLTFQTEAAAPSPQLPEDLQWTRIRTLDWGRACPTLRHIEYRVTNLWVEWIWLAVDDWKGYMKGDQPLDEHELAKIHIYLP